MELVIGYNLWVMLTIWHARVHEDPNVEDDFGMTALHCSAKKGDRKAVSLLTSQSTFSTCLPNVKINAFIC